MVTVYELDTGCHWGLFPPPYTNNKEHRKNALFSGNCTFKYINTSSAIRVKKRIVPLPDCPFYKRAPMLCLCSDKITQKVDKQILTKSALLTLWEKLAEKLEQTQSCMILPGPWQGTKVIYKECQWTPMTWHLTPSSLSEYNLTWTVLSLAPVVQYHLQYRKLQVIQALGQTCQQKLLLHN